MKRSRYTEEQIIYALRQAESGMPVSDVCRQMGIAEATFYVWKKKYANLGVTELRKLKCEVRRRIRRRCGCAFATSLTPGHRLAGTTRVVRVAEYPALPN